MSKYSALTTFLSSRTQPRISMSFEDIERIVGARLPQSAFNHRAWWSNNPTNSVMTRAWLAAGFRSEEVDMPGRKLVFSRHLPNPTVGPGGRVAPASTGSPLAGLFGGLKGTVHIEPGTDLTLPSTAPIYLYESADADLVQGEPELPAAAWPSLSPAAPSTTHQEYSPKSEPGGPEED
ncbi:hypothetical protein KHC23_14060 [Ancylobacter dichloromethanicus]|nr:hypothetical protein [Ancylobacter dichloromethanicus]MBS7554776.1 hypothetical protein [Ancylobacter dichloromethanicus]